MKEDVEFKKRQKELKVLFNEGLFRQHSSIILQTKALIIEEGNAAEMFLALHVRHLFKRKPHPLQRAQTQTKHCGIFFQLE